MAGVPSFDCVVEPAVRGTYTFDSAGVFPISFNLYEFTGNAGERYIVATALEGTAIEQPEIRWL